MLDESSVGELCLDCWQNSYYEDIEDFVEDTFEDLPDIA
jgi:hypothetical protein